MGSKPESRHLAGSDVGEDFVGGLAHFGVKGMKWGVRRKRDDGPSKPTKESASDDFNAAKVQKSRIKTSGTAALSNKELQAVITRTQLEQQYAKLTPESVSPGAKFASSFGNIAANAAKQVASQQVAKVMNEQLEAVLKATKK